MKKAKEQRNQKILQKLMQDQHNKRCMDCLEKGPFYVCTNFGTFVCNMCSGVHRESQRRVKSTSMSTFSDEEMDVLQKIGNSKARQIWLARWTPNDYPEPKAGDVSRIREFMKIKYEDKKWYDPNSDPFALEKDKKQFARTGIPSPEPITNIIPQNELQDIVVGKDIRINDTLKKQRVSNPQQQPQQTHSHQQQHNNSHGNTQQHNQQHQQHNQQQPSSLINTNKLPSLLDFDIPTQLPPPTNTSNNFNPFQQPQQTNPLFQQQQPQQTNPLFQQQHQQTNPLFQQQPQQINPLFQQQPQQQTNPLFSVNFSQQPPQQQQQQPQQPLSNPLFNPLQQQHQQTNPLFQQQHTQQTNPLFQQQPQQTNPLFQQQPQQTNPLFQQQPQQTNPLFQQQHTQPNPLLFQQQPQQKNPLFQQPQQTNPLFNPLQQQQPQQTNPLFQQQQTNPLFQQQHHTQQLPQQTNFTSLSPRNTQQTSLTPNNSLTPSNNSLAPSNNTQPQQQQPQKNSYDFSEFNLLGSMSQKQTLTPNTTSTSQTTPTSSSLNNNPLFNF